MIHELQIEVEPFNALIRGDQTFELRPHDRNYKQGDILHLRRVKPAAADLSSVDDDTDEDGRVIVYDGLEMALRVTDVLVGPITHAVADGWCLMTVKRLLWKTGTIDRKQLEAVDRPTTDEEKRAEAYRLAREMYRALGYRLDALPPGSVPPAYHKLREQYARRAADLGVPYRRWLKVLGEVAPEFGREDRPEESRLLAATEGHRATDVLRDLVRELAGLRCPRTSGFEGPATFPSCGEDGCPVCRCRRVSEQIEQ